MKHQIALLLVTGTLALADDFARQFENASAVRFSPGVEVDFSSLPSEENQLGQRLNEFVAAGFNTLLLQAIPAHSNSWQQIAQIAAQCRLRTLRFGCTFFSPDVVKDQDKLLRQIGWSRQEIEMRDYTTNACAPTLLQRTQNPPFARVLTPAVPSDELNPAWSVVVGRHSLPQAGVWYEYQFFAVPVQPLTIDYLNPAVFSPSVNNFLLEAQRKLARNYGTVFNWVWFPALSNYELAWTDEAPRWFSANFSLDLIRHLPVLAGVELKGAAYSQTIRQRYQQGSKRLWREKFAMNVRSLIQEAGLDAGALIDEIPLDPEETGSFFGVTVIDYTTNTLARSRNRRAAGGARVFDCKNIVGRIDSTRVPQLKRAVDALFVDGVDRILFDYQTLAFTGDGDFDSTNDLAAYIRRIQFVFQNSKLKSDFLLCTETIPASLDHYSFDCVNLALLQRAEINDSEILFASGRSYTTVVFSEPQLSSAAGRKVAEALLAKGHRVLTLDTTSNSQARSENSSTSALKVPGLGEIKNQLELLPDLTWSADQAALRLRFAHSFDSQREFYLIQNESEIAGMVTLTFKTADFKRVSRWQPIDGKIYEISHWSRSGAYHSVVPTLLRPNELFFIVFER
ncbi:MAG: hypothetical protein PHO37_02365 [Kiritimatiellae bacterium]|nr:hypothetical protein [Kiritimatiellia bacterium]